MFYIKKYDIPQRCTCMTAFKGMFIDYAIEAIKTTVSSKSNKRHNINSEKITARYTLNYQAYLKFPHDPELNCHCL